MIGSSRKKSISTRGKIMMNIENTFKRRKNFTTKLMLELGVPAHLKGYHYIRTAVIMAVEDMEIVSSVTKLLYPDIAKHRTKG